MGHRCQPGEDQLWTKTHRFPQITPLGCCPGVGGGGDFRVPYLGPAPSALATSTVAVECLPPVSSSELTSHCTLLDLVLSRLTPFLAFTLRGATLRAGSDPPPAALLGLQGDFAPQIPPGSRKHHPWWRRCGKVEPTPAPLCRGVLPPHHPSGRNLGSWPQGEGQESLKHCVPCARGSLLFTTNTHR